MITIAMMDPEHPLVYTAEWEDQPDGNFPGPGKPMTMGEMEASIERVLGVPVTLTPPPAGAPTLVRRLAGRNTRVADRYRDRGVFLVGDAAHVHSAAGGPGLNLACRTPRTSRGSSPPTSTAGPRTDSWTPTKPNATPSADACSPRPRPRPR